MTTQILTGDYGSGYALKAAYSTLIVQAGATISGGPVLSLYQYVTVSNAGHIYGGPSTSGVVLDKGGDLTNTGVIEGGGGVANSYDGGHGGDGVAMSGGGSVENSGMITGGAGYANTVGQAGSGGYGVDLFGAASVTNSGAITGGVGSDSGVYAGGGGGGVQMMGGRFTNLGMLVGGNGGDGVNGGAAAGGGVGLKLFGGVGINQSGVIEGGVGGDADGAGAHGAVGGTGVGVYGGTFSNTARIQGGAGGYGAGQGGYGGQGVYLQGGASVTNSGTIVGGAGGGGGVRSGGAGSGVSARGGSLTNLGMLIGGHGGDGVNGGAAGAGGAGVTLFDAACINESGVIEGGVGGEAAGVFAHGAIGGIGADVNGGTLSNAARIQGGVGGIGSYSGGFGGEGVDLEAGANLTNSGTIVGGAGGGGPTMGRAGYGVIIRYGGQVVNGAPGAGDAVIEGYSGVRSFGHGAATVTNYGTIEGTRASVALYASYDRLIVEKGAVFVGAVIGGGGTLQLVGGSGTITGLGGAASISGALAMTFSGFGVYALHAGGSWTLAGANTLSGGQRLVNDTGVTGTGTLTSDGKIFNTRHGVIDVTGGALTIDETGSRGITNLGLIEATGGSLVIEGPTLGGFGTIAAMGGDVTVQARVVGAGVARIDGGILAFEAKFEQTVAFSGAGGELALADSHDYHGTISGFSGGDSLDLGDIGYARSGEAKFSGTATGGLLTVRDGTYEARIHLAGDYLGATFTAASDGHGGVVVVDDSPLAIPPSAPPSPHAFVAAMAALTPAPAAAGPSPDRARLDAFSTLLAPRTQQT